MYASEGDVVRWFGSLFLVRSATEVVEYITFLLELGDRSVRSDDRIETVDGIRTGSNTVLCGHGQYAVVEHNSLQVALFLEGDKRQTGSGDVVRLLVGIVRDAFGSECLEGHIIAECGHELNGIHLNLTLLRRDGNGHGGVGLAISGSHVLE